MQDMIGMQEASVISGVKRRTLTRWAVNGTVPAAQFREHGEWYMNRADAIALKDKLAEPAGVAAT